MDKITLETDQLVKSPPKKILFTSVCRPLGQKYGDAPSVGYELLFNQVTREQGIFSPRAVHRHFSLDYIAENLDVPAVVLQYPSKRELIRELKKGYDYVGVSFLLAVFHRMKETVALIRKYAPNTKIVLGGYGTVLKDDVLAPYSDYICREEGVAYFRKLLQEPPIPMPYKHPLITSTLKIFSMPVSKTGMIFAGLGCPNGCDFCCTSHFFRRRHIRLLPEGKDILNVIERYLETDPSMSFVILDEDFLLSKKRALEFRDAVIKSGKTLSIFVFSSIKAISQYRVEEILEMGIDGFWIGYEGTRSNYAKQQGRPVEDIFTEFRQHGITILSSMIVGFDYQNQEVVAKELDGLMKLKPALCQFLIYGPTPGTPFYDRIMKEGLLQDALQADTEKYYRKSDGFSTMIKHPTLSVEDIQGIQQWCFKEDFQRLGPSLIRVIETWLLGYKTLKNSTNPALQKKAQRFAYEVRKAYPVFLAGRFFGPNPAIKKWIRELEQDSIKEFGAPIMVERIKSVVALGGAIWTAFKLKFNLFQHPSLIRTAYRFQGRKWKGFHLWAKIPSQHTDPNLSIRVELQQANKHVWVRLEGSLTSSSAAGLGKRIQDCLSNTKSHLVLDLERITQYEPDIVQEIKKNLEDYSSRVRLVMPETTVS